MQELIQLPPSNVKFIDNTMYKFMYSYIDSLTFNIKTKIHANGVFELNVNQSDNNDFKNFMKMEFNRSFELFTAEGFTESVSKTGVQSNIDQGVGSVRFSTCSKYLALVLNHLLDLSLTLDYIGSDNKSFYAVADYFRFMRYTSGGEHYPHYDSDFIFNSESRSTHSLVMYHTSCEGGELVFCEDTRPNYDRSDWKSQTTEEQINLKINPDGIKIVIFPHHLCHAVMPYLGNNTRDIIRGDLIFRSE